VKYGYVRGIEPVTYVKQIFERYKHYKQLLAHPELREAEAAEAGESASG
jgi:membrane-bound lytic murein transglycosylase MltF